jgi:hypothetical protein
MDIEATAVTRTKGEQSETSKQGRCIKPFAPLMEVEQIDEDEKKTPDEDITTQSAPSALLPPKFNELEHTSGVVAPVKISSLPMLEKHVGVLITSTEEKGISRSSISFKHSPLSTTELQVEVEYYDTAPDSYRISIATNGMNVEQMQPLYNSLQQHLSSVFPNKQLIFLPAALLENDVLSPWRREKIDSRKKIDCENRSRRLSSEREGESWLNHS